MPSLVNVVSNPASGNYSLEQVLAAAKRWLEDDESAYQLFERFHRASRTTSRRYVLSLDEILSLNGEVDRAHRFRMHALPISCETVDAALKVSEVTPSQIDTVIFTSCTSPQIPSIDAEVIQRLGFKPTTKRVPIYQQGCAGGVVGLSLADRLAKAGENVLLFSVELCSLLFRLRESSTVQLLGSALFADGCAASVITPGKGILEIIGTQSYLLPETGHLMGYDIREDGTYLRLDRELPSALQGVLQGIVEKFLNNYELKSADVPWWMIHPGGVKILDGIAALLGLGENQYIWARDVLSEVGNMSSATVQFVLDRFLKSELMSEGDNVMMVGIGPGLTVELILFRYAR